VILHTRTYTRGGFWGIGARRVVEVTAADSAALNRATAPRRATTTHERSRSSGGTSARPEPTSQQPQQPARPEPTAGDLIRRTYAVAKQELGQQQQKHQQPAARTGSSSAMGMSGSPAMTSGTPTSTVTRGAMDVDTTKLAEEVRAVRGLVTELIQQQKRAAMAQGESRDARDVSSRGSVESGASGAVTGVPTALREHYAQLLSQEVAKELADEVMGQVRQRLTAGEMSDVNAVQTAMRHALSELIPTDPTAGGVRPTEDGRPRTIALIGPTGVGKTTTVAKLAATFKLRQKKKVGLVTLDTYRIAAVEQLKTYAQILSLPMHVAMSPAELVAALDKCKECDVVLIDTAGRSQKDDPRLDQLSAFLAAANPHEVHLVLSSTCTQPVLLHTIERFSRVRADKMIFTKLDEAVTYGVMASVARRVGKQLSYVTTGQEVPHQIEPGRSSRIAELVLGGAV
jgi:flagellar biosynthesis protein FlhF